MKKLIMLFIIFSISACNGIAMSDDVTGSEIMLGTIRDTKWSFFFGYPKEIYLLSTDGSGETHNKAPWDSLNKPNWSPNGEWVVYDESYSYSEDGSSIHIAKADGSQPQRVSFHDVWDSDPSWSPDGKHIVYESTNTEFTEYNESIIYKLDVSCIIHGSNCNFIPTFISKGRNPRWSPDGKRIAFAMKCYQDHQYCINIMNADGNGEPLQISPSGLSCYSPQWAPNSEDLIFKCYVEPSCYEGGIFKAKADGSELEMLSNISSSQLPQYSPGGSRIVFISSHTSDLGRMIGWEAGSTNSVFSMNADGTGIKRLSLSSDEDVYWFTWPPFSLLE